MSVQADKRAQRGVVVALTDEGVEILARDVERQEAARILREERREHAVKFFPVSAASAMPVLETVNATGIVTRILGG